MIHTPNFNHDQTEEPIVISGIGMITSNGDNREAVWKAIQEGKSNVKRLHGIPDFPDDTVLGAEVDIEPDYPGQMRVETLGLRAAHEAMCDANINFLNMDMERFGCAISSALGTTEGNRRVTGHQPRDLGMTLWENHFSPNHLCVAIGDHFRLRGPRMSHAVACASSTVEVISAKRLIQNNQADMMLVGAGEAFHPLFCAGFRKMKVLADHEDPNQACRPFDADRNGFVMGEGAGMMIMERLSSALSRNAKIYGEVVDGCILSEALHVTSLDAEQSALSYAIERTLRKANIAPDDVGYVNVHGTGTSMNDHVEAYAINKAFGRAAKRLPVSATKSSIGHLVNAAGAVEVATTFLSLRDGHVAPTKNLVNPDENCQLDHVQNAYRKQKADYALKTAVAFGGHVVTVLLKRWNDPETGFQYPEDHDPFIRKAA